MKITDLYQVATLGNKIDEEGFFKITFTHKIDFFFDKFKDIFLIFKDHSVRYVTIDKVKCNRSCKIKILEAELNEDIIADGKVKVCLEKKDIPNLPADILFVGFKVYSDSEYLGEITDVMYAKFNEIFVIALKSGKEITLPNVEHFIRNIDKDANRIYIRNYEELLKI